MDGTTAVFGNDVPFEVDFGDILEKVNIALSVNMELNNGTWFAIVDPMYTELEMQITKGPIGGQIDINLIILDALLGHSVTEKVDVFAGVRYYDQEITVIPNLLSKQDLGDDWVDFVVGGRVMTELNERWGFTARLDVAAAGDSDSAWYAQAMFSRYIGDNKNLNIGYRHYDVDYESGSGLSRFKWDTAHSGLIFGFSWEF